MQIIYLGYAIPEERGINNPAYSAAGNKFELGILDGITNEYTVNANLYSIGCALPDG